MADANTPRDAGHNFISQIIQRDLEAGANEGRVVTRFPPEPNGYLHIGHAMSICLNFGLAQAYGGTCHLRFDDTNPETEDIEFVESIQRDVRWLGFDWDTHLYFASDYFERLYDLAEQLVRDGKAYVDSLTSEEIRAYRGTVTEAGRESPYRNRSVAENLDLLRRMRAGEFADGQHVLRAKIDMASPNMLLRDPLMYRIRHAHHYRRGNEWCIYPLYDWAHGQSDAIEQITHSVCTLEFEVHRPLYDWYVENLGFEPRPRQYEFARLNVEYMVTSKRKLKQLVEEGHVHGWDDPRMPTLAALRRRGIPAGALREFIDLVGVTRVDSRVDLSMLEYAVRNHLNHRAPRVMAVLNPLKVELTNLPEDTVEWVEASYWPHDIPKEGTRKVPLTRTLFIERDDFREDPPRKFFRLAPGREVRLRHGYIIRCDEVVKDEAGEVVLLRCSVDPESRSGGATADRRVKGTIHWVSATHSIEAEVRLYDRLFAIPNPSDVPEGESFLDHLNPESEVILKGCRLEPSIQEDPADMTYQFERLGYFVQDAVDSKPGALVFNRVVSLRDRWAKMQRQQEAARAKEAAEQAKALKAKAREAAVEEAPAERPPLTPEHSERMQRYVNDLGLNENEAYLIVATPDLHRFFEETLALHDNAGRVANWLVNELMGELKDQAVGDLQVSPQQVGQLLDRIADQTVSRRLAKDVLAEMLRTGDDPDVIVERHGWRQVTDLDALTPVVASVLSANPDKVAAYRAGKRGLIGFFVGQVMRQTGGKANPKLVRSQLETELEAAG